MTDEAGNRGERAHETGAGPTALALVGLAAFAAALAVRLTGLGAGHVTLDEVYTQFAVSRDWGGLVLDRAGRGHMPTYFALTKLTGADVTDIVALRRQVAVADAVAAGILAAAIARFAGIRAGLYLGALYATAPVAVHWAQNARPYGLLMAFVATGLWGAMALFHRAGAGDPDGASGRGPDRAFALGWTGACFTLTGGIFAYVSVVLLPRVLGWLKRGGAAASAPFRRRWRRAALAPSLVAVFAYLAVSRPHVYEGGVSGFWVEEYRPLNLQSLWWLLQDLVAGLTRGDWAGTLPQGALAALVAALGLTLLALAILGGRRVAGVPALWPVIALAAGYAGILLAASVVSSLLVDRYFLPAWAAFLALAAVGLARFAPWAQAAIGLPLLAAQVALALATATADSTRDAPVPAAFAAAIEGSGARDAPIHADELYFEIRREILSLRLDAPALPRPDLRGYRPHRAEDLAATGAPFFVALRQSAFADAAPLLPPGTCTLRAGDHVLALAHVAPCPAPFSQPSQPEGD